MAESREQLRARAARIVAELARHYPRARCTLDFRTPLELLVATILSAQCTDERVNRVTPALFARYPTAAAYAAADPAELEELVRPTGFFRNKARSIRGAAAAIVERHGGKVPGTIEALTALPGVGRKTANVVLGNAFGVPGIVVDTHVGRVARRLRLSRSEDPVRVEADLGALAPPARWTKLSHELIAHGRALCRAPKPRCAACFLGEDLCPSRRAFLRQPPAGPARAGAAAARHPPGGPRSSLPRGVLPE